MPFVWVNEPQTPPPTPPLSYGEDATSTLVDKVANTVNAGGSLIYYTPNTQYNVVYVVPEMNVNTITLTNAMIGHLTITISANVNVATINTATIGNVISNTLTIEYGTMGGNPTSNSEIATKEYLDTMVANVPASGSDLQNIIDAAGDLLVGISANTATRLPIGSAGQVLTVDYSDSTGLRWKTIGSTTGAEYFSGLWLQTHRDRNQQNTQVWLRRCDDILFNDGSHGRGWSNMVCDITVSGAGGLDTGTPRNSQWYELYAIRDEVNDLDNLIFHQSTNITQEANCTTTSDQNRQLRRATTPLDYIGQSFVSANSGPIHSVEFEIFATGSPSGIIWAELRSDDNGFPGSTLATTYPFDAGRIATDQSRIRFIFPDSVSVTAQTLYHIVLTGDYVYSDSNYITIRGITANTYGSGYAVEYYVNTSSWRLPPSVGGPDDLWFKVFIENISATDLVLPGGYDKYCLLGYVRRDAEGNLQYFLQKDRHIITSIASEWRAGSTETGRIEAVDMSRCIPPRDGVAKIEVRHVDSSCLHLPIGGFDCTDMPITFVPTKGYTTANTHGIGSVPGGYGVRLYAPIVLEHQVLLIRSNVAGSNVYITDFQF